MQYADFARKQKSHKKMSQILTNALRLLPTKPSLWIYAANYAIESQGDMTEARSYMQRGLRFCKRSEVLWLEYAKLELMYIAKIFARRSILGLDEEDGYLESQNAVDDPNADKVALPVITAEDFNPTLHISYPVDQNAIRNLETSPTLSGAIPIAIFDAAMEEFKDDLLGEKFFDLVATAQSIPCSSMILRHITERLTTSHPTSSGTLSCFIREPTIGTEPTSLLFPEVLEVAFNRFKSSTGVANLHSGSNILPKTLLDVIHKLLDWLLSMIAVDDLDPDINIVLSTMLKRMLYQYRTIIQDCGGEGHDRATSLARKLLERGFGSQAISMNEWCSQIWPSNPSLSAQPLVTKCI